MNSKNTDLTPNLIHSRAIFSDLIHPFKTQDQVLALVNRLHSTLDIKQVILLFTQDLIENIRCDGVRYEHHRSHTELRVGKEGPYHLDYELKVGQDFLGNLTFVRLEPWSADSITRLEDQLVFLLNPLRNAVIHTLAIDEAHRDPLTGLLNRTTLEESLTREIKLAHRHQQELSLLMLDLDNFKKINDTYGHLAGDYVLQHFSLLLQTHSRETDLLYRLGGEEFLFILSNTDREGANILGERIRIAAEESNPEYQDHRITLTSSIGLAGLESNDSLISLLERADQALYRAKHLGKNRVSE